jgi:ribosome-associated protein
MAVKKSAKKPAKKAAAKKPAVRKPAKKLAAKKPGHSKGSPRRAPSTKPKAASGSAKRRPQVKSRRPSLRPKRPARALPKATTYPENPAALALARAIAHVAVEKKANDVLIIDTRARGSAVGYDYVVIASGESDRQLEAIATAVDQTLRPQGTRAASVEASADWVLANYHDVVAHFFTPDTRGTYDLEGLWSDAPRVSLE